MILPVSAFEKPRLRRNSRAILVLARDDLLARRLDAVDEGQGEEFAKSGQGRRRLMGEARGGIFGMADRDLLEILDAPEVAVLADGAQIKARDAQRFRADFGIPAIEAAKENIGRAVRQAPGFDRIEIIDEEQEDVSVAGV